MRFFKYIICLFLLLPTSLQILAQNRVKLSGRVIDDEQNPVIFAIIKVEDQASGTTTDLQGRYQLDFSSADTVTVTFSMMGYVTKKKKLIRPQGNMRLNITLQTQSINIGEITVKDIRRQMNSTQQLNTENLKRLPSTTGNAVEELVSAQAGVSTHNELSSQYNVRGGSFDENSVYINGVEIYRPMLISSGQQEGLSIINSDMVESINFSAGGFEAKYGDKMSSVLDITYKKPKKFETSVSASLLGAGLYVGYAKKRISMTHGVRYKTNQYMLGSLETKGEYSPRFLDYQTYISWSPNRHWSLDFIGNISQNKYDFLPADRHTKFGTMQDVKSFRVYFDGKEKDLFRTLFGTLNLSHHFTDRTRLSFIASAFATKEQETYDIQGQYWLDETHTTEQLGVGTYMEHARNYLDANMKSLKLLFSHTPKGHNIQTGLTWKHETIRENSREWEMRDSAGYSIPHTDHRLDLIYNQKSSNRISSNRIELFSQDTWRFTNRYGIFSLNYGVRMSYWNWNKEWLFSPRISLGIIPTFNEDFTFRIATGLYYQAPFYKELRDTVTIGGTSQVTLNSDIKSQRSLQVVLGGDYRFKLVNRPFKFTTEIYYKALSNLIPYNVDNVKIVYYGGNIGSGYTTGIDFKLFGEFVVGTDSWISFSLMKAQQKVNGKSFPQATDQRYNLNFFFSDFFPGTTRWKMTLKACIADGLPFGPPHTGLERMAFRAPAYKRVDIGMSYRLLDNEDGRSQKKIIRYLRNIWLGVDCFNLFDISNVSSYYWVTDVTNQQYAVPNFLTRRQINARILIEL
ncbi:TonB-dependent receptor [Phocaeicola sartorii]|uniref:TonB-dependent receptor n=1 Tax=Phocaeicola sartorii TaxID=671267 RepID=UPI00258F5F73|nr:TonB-dependent receptor [Phocaeicola sartorii]